MLLAIDTSCDDTGVALLDIQAMLEAGIYRQEFLLADLISSQVALHRDFGGVVPELAAREHVINLPYLVQRALLQAGIGFGDLTAVAVTRGPGLNGCLLVGLSYAKALAYSLSIPLLPLHHIEGHIFAAELMPENERPLLPMLALVVSGGHTMLVQMAEFRKYQVISRTRDDAAGEAFDKCASLLSLPYPGGPSLSKAALNGDRQKYRFPIGVANDPTSFSFSGMKTAVQRTVTALADDLAESQVVYDLAASVELTIAKALTEKSLEACRECKPESFLLTGGVAANTFLRQLLRERVEEMGIKFCVPIHRWCTDNGAMIAILAALTIQQNKELYVGWKDNSRPLAFLGPQAPIDVGAVPRWAL